jgi:hypothetical protein
MVKTKKDKINYGSFSGNVNYMQLAPHVDILKKTLENYKNLKCITYEDDFECKIIKYPIFSPLTIKTNKTEYSFYDNFSYINNYINKFDLSNNYITISAFIFDTSNNRYCELYDHVLDAKYQKIFYKSYYYFDFFEFCMKNIKSVLVIKHLWCFISMWS